MNNQFIAAIEQICEEKGISKEIVLETIEQALAAAYKKDYGERDQEVRVEVDETTGAPRVFVTKIVVDEVTNPNLEITKGDAQVIKKSAKVGDEIEIEDMNRDFGRVAAQTAKQVLLQRIREAEREVVFTEFSDKEDSVLNGSVQRIENGNVFVDLGRGTGVMYPADQIRTEKYYVGQRVKVYVVRVEQTVRGPQIIVSRTHPNMVKKLFEMEVPEIDAGSVEIVNVAREAGNRSKIAVRSNVDGVDAVGTFVGGRGTRVQAVMADIADEKIDIIPYSTDPKTYIASALSPTEVISVKLDEEHKQAVVKVPEDQLSLAIGKQGQNVRLAAKLTGWNVDIDGADEASVEETADVVETAASDDKAKKSQKVDLEAAIIAAAEEQAQPESPAETSADTTDKPKKAAKKPVAKKSTTKKSTDEPEVAADTAPESTEIPAE